MTGRALTRALIAGIVVLAAVTLLLIVDAIESPEPTPTGTTAPRSLP